MENKTDLQIKNLNERINSLGRMVNLQQGVIDALTTASGGHLGSIHALTAEQGAHGRLILTLFAGLTALSGAVARGEPIPLAPTPQQARGEAADIADLERLGALPTDDPPSSD